MLLSSYNHEPLSGDCFEDSGQGLNQQQQEMLPSTGALANCSMQEHGLKPVPNADQAGGPSRALRIKPQPNQVLKCPRCNSLNTKFCYYNNYSLTQPRHFCKNCRRYWTKGGALRNVPVGGGCRKNKRAKQKNSDQSSGVSAGSDKGGPSFGGNENLSGRHGQLLAASTSGLYDLAAPKEEEGIGLNPYARIPHTLRLGDHPGTSSSGLSFEIPIPRVNPQASGGMTFSSLPINLPGFEAAGLSTATLNFQGLMKHENGGEFTPIYDPSLNLLGGGGGGGPPVSAAQAPVQLSEGLSSFNIGLENFVGLGLNGDLKWRQAQQPQQQKIATLVDGEQGQDQGIHHHHHHHGQHQSLLQLDESRPGGKGSLKSALVGLAAAQDQVHEQQQAAHSSGDWQGQQQQQQQQHQQQQQQQHQQQEFMEPTGDATYWNSTGWPIDLPIYVDHQQYCDVKPVEQAVPDFYSRATSMSRCTPSLT